MKISFFTAETLRRREIFYILLPFLRAFAPLR